MTTAQLVQKEWDYSQHAAYYQFRPNYSEKALDVILAYVNPQHQSLRVADIGAGTGNLSILLEPRGLQVTAVEPNDAMREIGIHRTQGSSIQWVKAEGTVTTLPAASFEWVTFGSSFNVIDRQAGLQETARLLVPEGYFTCLWNHRNLNDPIQNQAEAIIQHFVPHYERGVRREDQRPCLEASPLFRNIFYLEVDFEVERTIDTYLDAWKSVKNKFWDFSTPEGQALFEKIQEKMREALPANFKVQYTTRGWSAQKA